MRSLILFGPDDLRLEDVPVPEPDAGEVVLRVEAAVTCATDAKMMRRGAHPALPALPAPFGHEASGRVAAVGAGVGAVREGDAVVVANSAPCDACRPCRRARPGLCEAITYLSGAYAEYLRVPAPVVRRNLVPRPEGMDPALAAMTEPVACAVRGVERSAARPGDEAVVLGGGLQGLVSAALLARRGCEVTVCDPHPERRALALRFGAARALPAPRDAEGLGAVRERTRGGAGADVVMAAVGEVAAWEQAVALARPGGEVNLHGGPAAGSELRLPAAQLHYGEVTLQASYHHTPHAVRVALALIAAGDLPFPELLGPAITLEEVPAVLRAGGPKRPVAP